MTPAELRRLMQWLAGRVSLVAADSPEIGFDAPGEGDLLAAGFERDGVRRLLAAPWWNEMAEEIIATPAFCEPDDPPETVLGYARDVVYEYLRKRFTP